MHPCLCCCVFLIIMAAISSYAIYYAFTKHYVHPCDISNNTMSDFRDVTNCGRSDEDDGCLCKTYSCGCCVTVVVPEIYLNDTGCVDVAYLPDEYGVAVTLTLDGKALINETISARNPPPLCISPPEFDVYLHICLRFYDLSVKGSTFHACAQIEFKMFFVFTVDEIKLGCFNLGVESPRAARHLVELLSSVQQQQPNATSLKALRPSDWRPLKRVLDSKMAEFWKVVLNENATNYAEIFKLWGIVLNETIQFGKSFDTRVVLIGENATNEAVEFEDLVKYEISNDGANYSSPIGNKDVAKAGKNSALVEGKTSDVNVNGAANLPINLLLINLLWVLVIFKIFHN